MIEVIATFSVNEIKQLWVLLNERCFDGRLREPIFSLEYDLMERANDFASDNHITPIDADGDSGKHLLGLCLWQFSRNRAVILLDKSITDPRTLVKVMAHEMVHQDLAEQHGFGEMCRMGHGPAFKAYKQLIERYPGLRLTGEDFDPI